MPKEYGIGEFYSALEKISAGISFKKKLGSLVMGELIECKNVPTSSKELEEVMNEAADILKVTVVSRVFHSFNPQGLSGVLILAESHFSIHTWPEYNAVAVDIFSCSEISSDNVIEFLKRKFESEKFHVVTIPRGISLKN